MSRFSALSVRALRCGAPVLLAAAFLSTLALTGCGSNGSPTPGPTPTPTGSTTVTLMLTATGNDRLTSFVGTLESLTLTSQSGNTANVFTSSPYTAAPEFHHLNGSTEPYVTVSVPDGTYTSATVTMSSAEFSCATEIPGQNGGLNNEIYATRTVANSQVTVSVPTPIVISQPTGLALNLQEASSAIFPSCVQGVPSFSITPNFELQQLPFGELPTALADSEATTVVGTVASVASGGASLVLTLPDGPSLTVSVPAGVTIQGAASAAAIAAGEVVDMDIGFNTDASVFASRIEVLDSDVTNLTTAMGPLEFIGSAEPSFLMTATQIQGLLSNSALETGEGIFFSFGSAQFGVYGGSTILQNLPFTPSFTAANMVPGQNVLITTHATALAGGPLYLPATTVTLMPQTVDAAVTAVQTSGMLTTYTVTLAPYDLFVNLASQPGQNTLIPSPQTMTVYTYGPYDGLESSEVSAGATFRFTGLVFNDNGSLSMACTQILAGVAQ